MSQRVEKMDSNIQVHVKENHVTPRTFKAAAKTGKIQFYRVRRNGTTRHIPYLPPESKEREIAEKVEEERQNGVSVSELAAAMGISQPTVRRHIERLRFSRAIDKAKAAEIGTLIDSAIHLEE